MSESATQDAIEAVARDSYGRLVAYIASRTGDIADAHDALSEALAGSRRDIVLQGTPGQHCDKSDKQRSLHRAQVL